VILNGKIRIDGSGDGIADGSLYLDALNQFRYSSSPIAMHISSFVGTTGSLEGSVHMVSPTTTIADAKIVYYLLEDNVSTTETHVVRSILYEDFALSGAGSNFNFTKTFTLNPSWNTANMWAIAAVQLQSKTIMQAASSLQLPTYNFRAAMDWNANIEGPANFSYTSLPIWFFNQGAGDNYTMRIEVDYSPEGWYFNYCGEDGSCYPGDTDRPFSLGAGESISYHLNLWIGEPGIAYFRFVFTSPNLGTYSVPFRYKVEGVANDDPTLIGIPAQLGNVYPNPVKQNAQFELISAKNIAHASIEIYNLKGRKVQSIPAANLVQGSNKISFNPAAELPNGVYFYRIAGSATKSGRFILMK
ncbi:MAG: T9SS type A sorting domain-containing protein, partial [Candidatus Cloacimonas sp.]|nr:T9SS type A sorting domain-containing protein [Candidatus Cloacimonas sp.]